MHPFWQSSVDGFKEELSPHQFNTWIKPLRFGARKVIVL
ncbi:MAG: hypothetical protein HC782_04275 [Gammaproteobacteria bacterium]|nr:hypothetical protein [Gammaproteobacteria bacterium]